MKFNWQFFSTYFFKYAQWCSIFSVHKRIWQSSDYKHTWCVCRATIINSRVYICIFVGLLNKKIKLLRINAHYKHNIYYSKLLFGLNFKLTLLQDIKSSFKRKYYFETLSNSLFVYIQGRNKNTFWFNVLENYNVRSLSLHKTQENNL